MHTNNGQKQEKEVQEDYFWTCSGTDNNPHPQRILYKDECPECQRKKPRKRPPQAPNEPGPGPKDPGNNHSVGNREPKPKKDWGLLVALAILNLGSGFTTMHGAAQILPRFVGYSSGAAIQALLFFLVSGSTLRHARFLKWLAVGSFSIISVYTSFFAYYDLLVSKTREEDIVNRANSAHQNLILEVFTPIQDKAKQLQRELDSTERLMEKEVRGERISSERGKGPEYRKLQVQKENLEIKLAQVERVVDGLEPLFQYNLEGKSPQYIFDADRKALAQVRQNCLPAEPKFVCLPDKYVGSLNPQSPKYRELRATYFDEDARIGILAPFLKIVKGEPAAIAAIFMALLVDGCIILLGAGVEVRQRPQELALGLSGKGSEFLYKLLEAIDVPDRTIKDQILAQTQNASEYQKLLQFICVETKWIDKYEGDNNWLISNDSAKKLMGWLREERTRQLKLEAQGKSSDVVVLKLPVA